MHFLYQNQVTKEISIIIIMIIIILCGCQTSISPIPADSQQMLLVTMPTLDARLGQMIMFQRTSENESWTVAKSSFPVVVGKNGLAWGRGLDGYRDESMPIKKEGDGKSPAGVFGLSFGFGFVTMDEMLGLKIPYKQVTDILECVDDVQSQYYNSVVENTNVDSVDWTSSERMHRYTRAYDLGVYVEHNSNPMEPGAGSCIFLHVWSGPDGYTAGCTAMSRENMEYVMHWLDKEKNPILVQLTEAGYHSLQKKWTLPSF